MRDDVSDVMVMSDSGICMVDTYGLGLAERIDNSDQAVLLRLEGVTNGERVKHEFLIPADWFAAMMGLTIADLGPEFMASVLKVTDQAVRDKEEG